MMQNMALRVVLVVHRVDVYVYLRGLRSARNGR